MTEMTGFADGPAPQRPCTSATSLYSFKIQLEVFASGNILDLHFYKDKTMR